MENNNKNQARAKIQIDEPIKFVATTEVKLMPPKDFAAEIDSMFSLCFDDYEGCEIRCNTPQQMVNNNIVPGTPIEPSVAGVPAGAFYASLFFKYNTNPDPNKTKNLILVGKDPNESSNPSGSKLAERFRIMTSSRCCSSIYNVSDDTKSALEEFMYAPNIGVNTRLSGQYWKEHITEFSRAQINYVGIPGTPTVYVKISGLNLSALASKIYGSKDENGHVEYRVDTCVPTTSNGIARDVILQITKLNSTVLQNLLNGMYSGNYVTSTYYR